MSHRSLLARATEGTDAPTPGYVYVDLAKAATGNPNACQDMATYLTRRLASKQNPNIKFKCCKVIAKLCDAVPRNGFRRCVAQDHTGIGAIKEAMNYRGTPDPVRGDEPNQKVRVAAKECLDAVYREAPSSEMTNGGGGGGGYGGVSSNYGGNNNSNYNSNSGGYDQGGGAGRMQGIGNPRYSDPRNDPPPASGLQGALKEAGEVISGMIKDPLARNVTVEPSRGHSGNLPGYGAPSNQHHHHHSQYGGPPPGSAELSRQTGGQWTMASNRGPGAVQNDYQHQHQQPSQSYAPGASRNAGTVGGSWGNVSTSNANVGGVIRPQQQQQHHSTPSITINSVPGASTGGAGGTAVTDGTYEKNLVLELCPPGGMKPVPPPDKLANFARACASLNSDFVCPVLLDCCEDGQPWIIRAKALCAMETAIANGTKLTDGSNPYRDFFFACRDEITPLASHPRAAIHEPAKRVLALLGVSRSADAASSTTNAAAPVAAAPNLLDFDDDDNNAATTAAAAAAPAPSQAPAPPATSNGTSNNNNMFGGMQVKSGAAAASPAPPQQVKPPVAAATAAPNLLDFDAAASAPAPQQQQQQQPSNDIFRHTDGAGSTAVAAAPVVSATSSMFDQLSVKDSEVKKGDAAAAPATESEPTAANGSAFGFINQATPSSPNAPAPPPSFDPLKNNSQSNNLTPSSAAKKSMQMSPEQMQAMAYQQMMMQQQMQQMHMAMAMQQQMGGGGGGAPGGGVPMYPPLAAAAGGGGIRRQSSGGGAAMMAPNAFSFQATKPAKKDDKKFDFVKDAMQTAGQKK